jgi:hypothetical protein
MPLEKLTFTPNVPVIVALKFPEGKIVEGRFGDQVYYILAQPPNSCMYLDLGVAQKINALEPRKNELINICKRWSGKRNDDTQWDIWRSGPGETPPAPAPTSKQFASAATGIPETELERDLRLSLPWRDGSTLKTNQAGAGLRPSD